MNKTYYVCKYTPIELLEAFGGECQNLNEMPQGFDHADQIAHPNICGFGKALLEAVMSGKVKELVLVNCCDTIRSVYVLRKHMENIKAQHLMKKSSVRHSRSRNTL